MTPKNQRLRAFFTLSRHFQRISKGEEVLLPVQFTSQDTDQTFLSEDIFEKERARTASLDSEPSHLEV